MVANRFRNHWQVKPGRTLAASAKRSPLFLIQVAYWTFGNLMKTTTKTRSCCVNLVNSPGLWMFLFAGFGLLSLSLGEARIQNRMSRHQRNFESRFGSSTSQPDADGTGLPRTSEPRPVNGNTESGKYRLTGLRWILTLAGAGGLIMAGWSLVTFWFGNAVRDERL